MSATKYTLQLGASTDLSPEVYYSYLRVSIKSMLA